MCFSLFKSAASKMDQMKSEQIENQKELMKMKQDQIDSVQTTVETGMKSWVDIVKKNSSQNKQLTSKTVKEAVRAASEEEDRTKNFIIY